MIKSNQQQKAAPKTFVNSSIRVKNVRVVDDGTGTDRGVMSLFNAIELAKSKGLDLVQISFNAGIGICKICDYNKMQYEQKRRDKEAKKRAKANVQEIKEMSFSLTIDTNDKNIKLRHIKEFLADNCKVAMSIYFTRRELSQINTLGRELMKSLLKELEGLAALDSNPVVNGRKLSVVVKPVK